MMTLDELQELRNRFEASLLREDTIADILNKVKYTSYLTFDNLVLAYIQNKYANHIKSELSWNNIGCSVDEGSTPIYIINESKKAIYKDSETGEEIKTTELNPLELSKAIKLGLVKKEYKCYKQELEPWYSDKNIKVFDKKTYNKYVKAKQNNFDIEIIKQQIESENMWLETCSDRLAKILESEIWLNINNLNILLTYVASTFNDKIDIDKLETREFTCGIAIILINLWLNREYKISRDVIQRLLVEYNIDKDELLENISIAVDIFRKFEADFGLNAEVDINKLKAADALFSIMEANELSRRWNECRE